MVMIWPAMSVAMRSLSIASSSAERVSYLYAVVRIEKQCCGINFGIGCGDSSVSDSKGGYRVTS